MERSLEERAMRSTFLRAGKTRRHSQCTAAVSSGGAACFMSLWSKKRNSVGNRTFSRRMLDSRGCVF